MGTKCFLVVIEPSDTSFGAYAPDVPGRIATGRTREEVEQLIQEALEFHIEGLLEAGEKVPEPVSEAALVSVRIPAVPLA